jgi:exosome complex component CSL4
MSSPLVNHMENPCKRRVVVPGEEIATIEEYLPGRNAFQDPYTGMVRSKKLGRACLDIKSHIAEVEGFKFHKNLLSKDEIVYAVVERFEDPIAVLKIFYSETKKALIAPPVTGILHVMNASNSRVRLLSDIFGYGDVIRAYVSEEGGPPFYLSTRGRNFGVILAKCPRCMTPMRKRGILLYCPSCGYKMRGRKTSLHYLLK